MLSFKTAPATYSISEPLTTSIGFEKSNLLRYSSPNKGTTLKVDIILVQVQVQGSYII